MSPFGLYGANAVRGVKEGNGGVKAGKLFVVPCDLLLKRDDASRNLGSLIL